MKPAAIRKAVGMKRRIHFVRYYIAPMLEKGLIVRTDPDHPRSPRQEYRLAWATVSITAVLLYQ